jgi:hypothetical protein
VRAYVGPFSYHLGQPQVTTQSQQLITGNITKR